MRNFPEWSVAFWAAASIGAVGVPLNAWWTGPELEYGLADSGSVVLFCDAERGDRLRAHLPKLPAIRTTIIAKPEARYARPDGALTFEGAVGEFDPAAELPELAIDPEDDATIFYTSGTTGRRRAPSARSATSART
jgi:acyl-CoA synthetase (AMP-forming)/AMP-acid ligase II